MFLVVLRHCTVTHEGVIAAGARAVVVAVGAVVVAVATPAVDVAVKELKVLQDLHEAVKILGVKVENIDPIRSGVTPGPPAVVVQLAAIDALIVGTLFFSVKLAESVDDPFIRTSPFSVQRPLTGFADFLLRQFHLGDRWNVQPRVFGGSASTAMSKIIHTEGRSRSTLHAVVLASGSPGELVDTVVLQSGKGLALICYCVTAASLKK